MEFSHSTHSLAAAELDVIMPRMATLLANALNAEHCGVFAYSEDCSSTLAFYRHGYQYSVSSNGANYEELAPHDVPAEAEVLRTGEPLVRRSKVDFAEFPLLNQDREPASERLSDLVLPLEWQGAVQGVAYIWRANDPVPFRDDEIEAALRVGRVAGMAIVFARQHETERIQRQRLDTLLDVAGIATSEQRLEDVLQTLARSIRSANGTDVCGLYVFDESGDSVLGSFQDGVRPGEESIFAESTHIPVSRVPVEIELRETLEPKLIHDLDNDFAQGESLHAYLKEQGISEVLAVPIVYQSDLVGVVYCWFRHSDRRFSNAAVAITEAIANQAGGVVSRARLQQAILEQSAESEALLRIGQAALTWDTLDPVLDEIAGVLRETIDYDYCYIGLLTPDHRGVRVIREWGESFRPILDWTIPVDASMSGIAIRTRRPVSTSNVQSDPRGWLQDPKLPPLRSVSVAPLLADHGPIGTLFIARDLVHVFTAREERLLALLAQHAAVAIERVQSRQYLDQRANRQALLAAVTELLVTGENPLDALQDIASNAAGVIADGIAFVQTGWDYESARPVATSFRDPGSDVLLRQNAGELDMVVLQERIEEILGQNEELLLEPDGVWPEHQPLRDLLERLGVSQMLILPLYQRDRSPGMMVMLSCDESGSFQDDDLEIGRIVARRIGDAIERHVVKQNQEALLRISELLQGLPDVDMLVQTFAREMEQILPFDQLYIAELDRERDVLETRVYLERISNARGPVELPAATGICGEVVKSRMPVMDNHANERAASIYHGDGKDEHYRQNGESVLVTPIFADNEVTGVLFMNRTGNNRFTTADFETFLLFAGLAGAALDRTLLLQHYRDLYRASIEVLAAVVDAKDPTTLEHSRHVAHYSLLGAELMELPPEDVTQIELAGLLHDIGKLGIPDRVLQKPGSLTEDEFALIKTHPDRGARILERHPALQDLVPLVRHHHEAMDGHGYPSRLVGEAIPVGAAIICVADAFDTMTSERTYQRRRTVEDALDELERCAGSQFHPEIVDRFVRYIREHPSEVYVPEDGNAVAGTGTS